MKRLTIIAVLLIACFLAAAGLSPQSARAEGDVRCGRKDRTSGGCVIEIRAPGSGGQPGKPGRPGRPRQDPITRPTTAPTYPGYPPCVGIPCLPLDQQHPPDPCISYTTNGSCASYLPGLPTPTDDPTGPGNTPAPATLARIAMERMDLHAPNIGLWPHPLEELPNGYNYVGWNNWMWIKNPTPNTWGPITKTVTQSGHSITATAAVTHLTWEMGNGDTKTCDKGIEHPEHNTRNEKSPSCGYIYHQTGNYTITATAHWVIVWTGLGQQGTIEMDLTTQAHTKVVEVSAVNIPNDRHHNPAPSPPPNQTGTPSREAPCPTNHNKHGC